MSNPNNFFRRLFSSPSLMLKLAAAAIFVSMACFIFASFGFTDKVYVGFGVLVLVYGLWRFYTFYQELNAMDDE